MIPQVIEPAPVRRNRSERAVSGGRPEFLEQAARSAPDPGVLDREDAVVPADGQQTRDNLVIPPHTLGRNPHTVSVRINGPDTGGRYRDRIDTASIRRADRIAGS